MPKQDSSEKTSVTTPFRNRRLTTFIICLLLSTVFWFLHALSKEYQIVVKVPVVYSHLPEHGLVAVDMPDSVDAVVSGSGFTVFAYQWANLVDPIELDARRARSLGNGEYALATSAHPEKLEGTIGNGLRVMSVMPDTLFLSFAGRVEKKVPVRPRVTVSCAPGFRLGDSIQAIPGYVIVSGADALIKKITYVETEQKTFTNLEQPVETKVRLVLPASLGQVQLKQTEVVLKIPVGQFTEQRMSVPVEPVNVPPNVVLKTIPDKIDVIFQVTLEDYATIHPEMFRAVADYSKADPHTGEIPVEIIRQPLNIRNLRAEPGKVEYIIRK